MKRGKHEPSDTADIHGKAEERLNANSKAAPADRTTEDAQRLLHELQVHQIELEMQNEELRRAWEEVEAGWERYADLFDFAPVSYFTLDGTGQIIDVNFEGAKLLGPVREALIEKPLAFFVVIEDRPAFTAFLKSVHKATAKQTCEFRLLRGEQTIHVIAEGYNARIEEHDKPECRVAMVDITQRKRAEEAVRESENRFKLLFEKAPLSYQSLNADGRFLEVNSAWLKALGYSREEVIDRPFSDFLTPAAKTLFQKRFARFKAAGEVHNVEFDMVHKNGNVVIVSFDGIIARDATGNFRQTHCILADVTDRKRTEKATRESEKKYRTLFENASEGLLIVDVETRQVKQANEAFCRMLDYNEDELLRLSVSDIHPKNVRSRFETAATKNEPLSQAIPCLRKDGTIIYADVNTSEIFIDGKKCLVGFFKDITQRKLAEDALRLHAERQTKLSCLMQEGVFAANSLDEKLRTVADSAVKILGADFCRIWVIKPGDLCNAGCPHAEVAEGPHVCRERDHCLHLVASAGRYTHIDGRVHRRVPFGCYKIGLIASGEESKFLTNDISNEPRVHDRDWARELGLVSFVGYRLVSSWGKPIGVMALFSKHRISPEDDSFLENISLCCSHIIQTEHARENLKLRNEELQTEITERKRVEKQVQQFALELAEKNESLQERAEALEAATRAKDDFLSNMSHELRTPLNAIIGFSEGLLERTDIHPLNEHQINRIGAIKKSGDHLLMLINGILDIARMESGKTQLNITTFDIKPIAEEIRFMAEALLKDRPEVRFSLELDDHLPPISSDRDKIRQILNNLVSNAVKFTRRGTIAVRIHRHDESFVMEVEDSGIGISQQHIDQVFEKFSQVPESTTVSLKGTGLGLTICKAYADMLGGTMSVQSIEGQGSTFTALLPLFLDRVDTEKSYNVAEEKTQEMFQTRGDDDAPVKILCVESNAANLLLLTDYLHEAGYNVVPATGGQEAAELAVQEQPQAIILGMLMSDVDSWELLQKLKTDSATRHVPTIVVTSEDEEPLAMSLGADDYLRKPVSRTELLDSLLKVMAGTARKHPNDSVDSNTREPAPVTDESSITS